MTQQIETLITEVEQINAELHVLNKSIADKVYELSQKKKEVQGKLDKEIYDLAKLQLAEKEYGCGTANIDTPSFKIKTVVSKKVKWDEEALRGIAKSIQNAGRDPEEFIKYKLSVSETDYKKFDPVIQEAFLPARSVEPSAPAITWERK